MRKLIGLGLALVTGLVSTAALAQEEPAAPAAPAASAEGDKGPIGLGADVGILLPIGNLGDATGLMIGGLLKLEYPLSPALEATGRIGYFHGLSKEPVPGFKYSWSDIPIWAGARYFFGGARDGLYAGGEVGLNMISVKSEVTFMGTTVSGSGSETYVGLNGAVGYKVGDIDLRGNLHFLDIGHLGDSMGIGLTAGYSFAKF